MPFISEPDASWAFAFWNAKATFSRRTQHHAAQAQHMRKGHLGKSSVISSVADKSRF